MSRPFLILALPRSRTFWLSRFLSYGGAKCHHEPSVDFSSKDDIGRFFSNHSAADTALSVIIADVLERCPGLKIVAIRRPMDEVIDSCRALLGNISQQQISVFTRIERTLDDLEAANRCRSYDFSDLVSESVCADLFEHCLDRAFDPVWWGHFKDKRLVANHVEIMVKASARHDELVRVFS